MHLSNTFILLWLTPLLALSQGAAPDFRKDWKIHAASSFEPGEGIPQNVLDGQPGTHWHSHWSRNIVPLHPHEIAVDMGRVVPLSGLIYLPRQARPGAAANGRIERFQYLTSTDGSNWTQVASGKFPDGAAAQTNTFSTVTARYFKLIAWSGKKNDPWAAVAELDVIPADAKLRATK